MKPISWIVGSIRRAMRTPVIVVAAALSTALASHAQLVQIIDRQGPGAGLISVTPSTPPAAAAAAVRASGVGLGRGLVMTGFADDIGNHDFLISRSGRASVRVASPWIAQGGRVVAARLQSWLDAFAGAGGTADFVVFHCRADLGAQRYSRSWSAIQSDPRGALLLRSLGFRSLPPAPHADIAFVARWRSVADERLDIALTTSVMPSIRRALPNAGVAFRGHATRSASASRIDGRFGTHDLASTDPCDTASAACLTGLRSAVSRFSAASSRPAAILMDRSLCGDLDGWREAVIHSALCGAARVLSPLPGDGAGSGGFVQTLNAELSGRLAASAAFRPVPPPARVDPSLAVSSGASALRTHLRISVPQSVEAVRIAMADGSQSVVRVPAGQQGVWFEHPRGDVVQSVDPTAAPDQLADGTRPLLYDSFVADSAVAPASNAEKYMLVGQYDVDRTIAQTGIIDPQLVIAQVERLIASGHGSRWGVLDFEDPFDLLWDSGDRDPRYRPALQSMIDTVRALRTRFPDIKWTYYGVPRVKYWLSGRVWSDLTQAEREAEYRKAVAPVAALMPELDFVMPGVYDVYEDAMGMPTTMTPRRVVEASWRTANVEAIKQHFRERGMPVPPIVPMVSPWFQPGGFANAQRPIPMTEFMEEQVKPLLDAGSSGIALWGAMRYFARVANWPEGHPDPAFRELRTELRAQFARDYWPSTGSLAASVRWDLPETAQMLAQRLDVQMSDAISAVAESTR